MRGDIERSEKYYRRAMEAARSMPSAALAPNPLLKVSGIYISLASALEDSGNTGKAFEALRKALELFGSDPLAADPASRTGTSWTHGAKLSQAEHIRAIGLSQKLGQLALQISTSSIVQPYPAQTHPDKPKSWNQAAEAYLTSALTAMLRMGLATYPATITGPVVVGRDVDLPDSSYGDEAGRVDKRGLGMTLESLSEVYARKGETDVAGQLLLQAISTLLPPNADEIPPVADQCQGRLSSPLAFHFTDHPYSCLGKPTTHHLRCVHSP